MDFFAQRLDYTEFYFVFAPVSLSINVTRFLASQEVRGILIIPLYPYSVWFNFFFPDGSHYCHVPNINSPTCFANSVG